MVLENLISAKSIEKKPLKMVILGAIIPSICILVSQMFGAGEKGLILVFLITFAMIPLMVKLMYIEEKRDHTMKGYTFWEKHGNVINAYSAYFITVSLTLALWFYFLPTDFTDNLFAEQLSEIGKIRGTGSVTIGGTAQEIIFNNFYVMGISFVMSFLFASGAIFILTWNASVLGVVVGQLSKESFGSVIGIPLSFSGFAPHGIPEILAYFLAGLAGGILSRAVEKHNFFSDNFKTVLWDATKIFTFAVFLIIVAGFIESLIINI